MGNSLLAVRDINHKYIVVERQMVLMRNDAFEKREQILKLRMKVLKVEQERMDGVNTLSLSEVRKKLSYRMNKS